MFRPQKYFSDIPCPSLRLNNNCSFGEERCLFSHDIPIPSSSTPTPRVSAAATGDTVTSGSLVSGTGGHLLDCGSRKTQNVGKKGRRRGSNASAASGDSMSTVDSGSSGGVKVSFAGGSFLNLRKAGVVELSSSSEDEDEDDGARIGDGEVDGDGDVYMLDGGIAISGSGLGVASDSGRLKRRRIASPKDSWSSAVDGGGASGGSDAGVRRMDKSGVVGVRVGRGVGGPRRKRSKYVDEEADGARIPIVTIAGKESGGSGVVNATVNNPNPGTHGSGGVEERVGVGERLARLHTITKQSKALRKEEQLKKEEQMRRTGVAGVGVANAGRGASTPKTSTTSTTPTMAKLESAAVTSTTVTTSTSSTATSKALSTPIPPSLTYTNRNSTSTSASSSTAKPTLPTLKAPVLVPKTVTGCPAKWNVRMQLLTLLHAEYLRLYHTTTTPQDPEIISLAIEEEAEVARTKAAVYPNVMKNRIMALKKADDKAPEWIGKRQEMKKKREGGLRKGLETLAAGVVSGMGNMGGEVRKAGEAGGQGQFAGPVTVPNTWMIPSSICPPTSATTAANSNPVTVTTSSANTSSSNIITDARDYIPLTTSLTSQQELQSLSFFVPPTSILIQYGFILEPISSTAITEAEKTILASGGYETCDRCETRFQVFPERRLSDGRLASGGKCTYHWGKAFFPPKSFGGGASLGLGGSEKTYTCCGQAVGESLGCTEGEYHVFKVNDPKRLAIDWNWESPNPDAPPQPSPPASAAQSQSQTQIQMISSPSTPTPSPAPVSSIPESDLQKAFAEQKVAAAFSIDCEMCYTTKGMEVVRVTMLSFPECETVLDALVRPYGEVLDLNTRFSGVTPQEYVSARVVTHNSLESEGGVGQSLQSPQGKTSASWSGKTHKDTGTLRIFPTPLSARTEIFRIMKVARTQAASNYKTKTGAPPGEVVLIGHALENDLSVLRIAWEWVVDTCVLFPHSRGFPVRNRLAWLTEKLLKWRIQMGEGNLGNNGGPPGEANQRKAVVGHDSKVDAFAAGELVRWKIRDTVQRGATATQASGNGPLGKLRKGTPVGGRGLRGGDTAGKDKGMRYDGVAEFIKRERELAAGTSTEAAPSSSSSSLASGVPVIPPLTTSASASAATGTGTEKRKRGIFTESDGSDQEDGDGHRKSEPAPPAQPAPHTPTGMSRVSSGGSASTVIMTPATTIRSRGSVSSPTSSTKRTRRVSGLGEGLLWGVNNPE